MSVKHNAKVPHDDRCRDRIGELMEGDDDQRQVDLMASRTAVEVENEIPCPEAGEEVDVGESTVVEDQRSDPQCQFPQFEWVDQEQVKQTQMIVKRNVSDSQKAVVRKDKLKMLKNWQ